MIKFWTFPLQVDFITLLHAKSSTLHTINEQIGGIVQYRLLSDLLAYYILYEFCMEKVFHNVTSHLQTEMEQSIILSASLHSVRTYLSLESL